MYNISVSIAIPADASVGLRAVKYEIPLDCNWFSTPQIFCLQNKPV